ncbi:unnamed protein product [Protopolystoma xenopodis]|uniref:Uncharacterized protein n=1 Tax=Protopolystoma xenopodis TaxID=117903 RepID=A0A3S5C7Z1_9PLAT|nr:unnamed protein product [Protopolystoma xenopodis]
MLSLGSGSKKGGQYGRVWDTVYARVDLHTASGLGACATAVGLNSNWPSRWRRSEGDEGTRPAAHCVVEPRLIRRD